jgi:KaiC/GvpD/RAD55 family RecA-like ATPase
MELTFNFDENFQAAVAGYLMTDKTFLVSCQANVPYTLFADPYVAKIVSIQYDYYQKYNDIVRSREELMTLIKQTFYGDVQTQKKHLERLDHAYIIKDQFRFEVITNQMTGWLKFATLKNGIEEMASKFNNRRYDDITAMLPQFISRVVEATFQGKGKFDFSDPKGFYLDFMEEMNANCCTIGHDDFDELLRKGSKIQGEGRNPNKLETLTKGSLFPGQATVVMGPTNAGKTSFITSVIIANVFMGKHVCYIGHEQSEQELVDKCYRAATGLWGEELQRAVMENHPRVMAASMFLDRFLHYYHWIKADNMYVEPVLALIKQENNKLMSRNAGKGFDMVVDDYPGKLKSKANQNKNTKRHEEMLYVYDSFVNLGKEEKFHGIYPAQVNREGYKANRGAENRMLDAGDAAGSYDLTHVVDNIITINRTPSDVANRRMKLALAKSRSATTGSVFVTKTDFPTSRTHGWTLPSKVFEAGTNPSDEACAMYFQEKEAREALLLKATQEANIVNSIAVPEKPVPVFDPVNPLFLNQECGIDPEGKSMIPTEGFNE